MVALAVCQAMVALFALIAVLNVMASWSHQLLRDYWLAGPAGGAWGINQATHLSSTMSMRVHCSDGRGGMAGRPMQRVQEGAEGAQRVGLKLRRGRSNALQGLLPVGCLSATQL
jgi:hypothetical protein